MSGGGLDRWFKIGAQIKCRGTSRHRRDACSTAAVRVRLTDRCAQVSPRLPALLAGAGVARRGRIPDKISDAYLGICDAEWPCISAANVKYTAVRTTPSAGRGREADRNLRGGLQQRAVQAAGSEARRGSWRRLSAFGSARRSLRVALLLDRSANEKWWPTGRVPAPYYEGKSGRHRKRHRAKHDVGRSSKKNGGRGPIRVM